MNEPIKFNLPGECEIDRFVDEWGGQYRIKKEPVQTETVQIYDTFDWRLFNQSLVLYQSGPRLSLRKLSRREISFSADIGRPPVFIWEFPDGELKEQLTPVIGVRALLKLAEIKSRSKRYGLLDQEGKTVVRLTYVEIRSPRNKNAPALAHHLWLQPVRGYPKDFQTIARRLEASGFTLNTEDDVYFEGLKAAAKKPGSYSSKVAIRMDPEMRADEAAKVVLRFLMHVIRVNQANIEKDIDTEFIHDFRVAVRRTRSALGQIRCVFPAKTTERFKKDFIFIGRLSNDLRDLDVCLLKEDAYKAKIAPVLRDDIQPLFDHLRKKRSEAFKKVIRGLKSKRYVKIIQDWERFLNSPAQDSPAAVNSGIPIRILARTRIYKKYRSVLKVGRQILADSDDQMLHVLRIHCKKLRYLMEFFAGLFPLEKMGSLIQKLKRLQDCLGHFNDLRVQEEYLLAVVKEFSADRRPSEKIFLAVGNLVGTLGRERQIAKAAIAEIFADFASSDNRKLFKDLITEQPPGASIDHTGHLQQ